MSRELSLEEKRRLARELLLKKKAGKIAQREPELPSYERFMGGSDSALSEVADFAEWVRSLKESGRYSLERAREGAATPMITAEGAQALNFSTYNYLGLSSHPQVVAAAKEALDTYGLGCGASPNASGKLLIHQQLEEDLVDYFGIAEGGVSLFSAGYNVNTGSLSALMRPGCHLVMDQSVHMSIVEGARLSGADIHTFQHNDARDLERILKQVSAARRRVMVCVEGVYSADGDWGDLAQLISVSKRYGALVMVDEAHSTLLCGPQGQGVAAREGVLESVDLLVLTFSKAFGGVGGALVGHRNITQYVNWYARSRLFSCALSPAVTAGVRAALRLARGPEGDMRRRRLVENADYLRGQLTGKVPLGDSQSWVLPVIFGSEQKTLELYHYVRSRGLDGSVMEFPAVPKGAARLRLFVTSEHTREQLDQAVAILLDTARRFQFAL